MQNTTAIVRSTINVFILIAIAISLFQELSLVNRNQTPVGDGTTSESTDTASTKQVELNGTRVEGIVLRVTDKFHGPVKEMLIKHEYNVEIKSYEFQGPEYWLNMALNYGHVIVVYILMGRYQSETDAGRKKKIMILGIGLVLGWFFLTPHLKTQRIAVEVNGSLIYQKDTLIEQEIVEKIT